MAPFSLLSLPLSLRPSWVSPAPAGPISSCSPSPPQGAPDPEAPPVCCTPAQRVFAPVPEIAPDPGMAQFGRAPVPEMAQFERAPDPGMAQFGRAPDPEIAPDPGMKQRNSGTACACIGSNDCFEGGNYGLFFRCSLALQGGNYGLFFFCLQVSVGKSPPHPTPQCKIGNFNAYGSEGPGATRVFRPTSWVNEHCDGAFLVDSFHYLKTAGRKAKQTQYFPELLQRCGKRRGWCSLPFVREGVLSLGLATVLRRTRRCWVTFQVRLGM